MKYKDFKMMTNAEMKNVIGGNPSGPAQTECTVICRVKHVGTYGPNYVVPVGSSCSGNFVCQPGDEVVRDCECTTVGQGGGVPGSTY